MFKPVQIHNNERDIEVPFLLDFVAEKQPMSLLDVGAFYSWYTYAIPLRAIMRSGIYEAVDPKEDSITEQIVDKYYCSSVLDLNGYYDFISCVSVIEHCGILESSPREVRYQVFSKLMSLGRSVFLSFPFGAPGIYPEQYENITREELFNWINLVNRNISLSFWYSEFPQGGKPFSEVDINFASTISLVKEKGTQCVCIMKVQ